MNQARSKEDFVMIIGDVLYALYNEETRRFVFYDVESRPVYDEENGKFIGWEVTWWGVEKKIFPIRIQWKHFYKETWFRNSERAAQRFKERLLKQSNNR